MKTLQDTAEQKAKLKLIQSLPGETKVPLLLIFRVAQKIRDVKKITQLLQVFSAPRYASVLESLESLLNPAPKESKV